MLKELQSTLHQLQAQMDSFVAASNLTLDANKGAALDNSHSNSPSPAGESRAPSEREDASPTAENETKPESRAAAPTTPSEIESTTPPSAREEQSTESTTPAREYEPSTRSITDPNSAPQQTSGWLRVLKSFVWLWIFALLACSLQLMVKNRSIYFEAIRNRVLPRSADYDESAETARLTRYPPPSV